jgi:N-acylneuraminate cytidylyltransferase
MQRLAIIPARGGSKRIPGKNIRSFAGKPILAYSIEAALNSKLFDEVMVSTDDPQIAEVARQFGASVPFLRSAENSDDFSTTVDVLLEVAESYTNAGQTFDTACCIYPTAPFVSAELLSKAFTLLEEGKFNSVFPVVAFDYPIQRSLQRSENGKVEMVWPEYLLSRSQDLPKRYHDTGLFYWYRPNQLINERKLFGENSGALIISELECHDIDSPDDWEMAELKFRRLFPKDI